jgi:hypothetical protein
MITLKFIKRLPIFLILFYSCESIENKESTLEDKLIGSWKEQPPYHDGHCDTLVFKSDSTIDKYIPLIGRRYQIISNDSLLIWNTFYNKYFGFDIELYGDTLLKIYNFLDRSATQDEKNITFKKI